ncbi:MAG TPA: hypothetical protein PKZ64_09585 [Spirochaetota bacterium]|nr:hypothetical protein [Spirochaetota bacterium]HPR37932.1 hypothetical protein [Spirochaetota bacterium]
MNLWKEIKEFLLKFSEVILTKTDILSQMAKSRIAIKRKEEEINKIRIETGDYTIFQIKQKESIDEDVINQKIEAINRIKKEIEELTEKFNDAKSKLVSRNKPEAGTESGKEKQAE